MPTYRGDVGPYRCNEIITPELNHISTFVLSGTSRAPSPTDSARFIPIPLNPPRQRGYARRLLASALKKCKRQKAKCKIKVNFRVRKFPIK